MNLLNKILAVGILVAGADYAQAQEPIVLSGDQLFGDLKARHIGPALMSGRINDLEGHPTNNRVIYAGTAGGGVWKSSNGGATFQPIFDKHTQSIGTVTLDPKDPDNKIWVGTGETWTRNSVSVGDGLYKSVDGGVNWTKVGFEKTERISDVVINPENTDIMYVAAMGALWGDNEERGVYKSTDGGNTWEKILYVNSRTGCSDLVMDPENPEVLIASMWEFRRTGWSFESGGNNSALMKSTDGGKTWNKIHNGFPEGRLGRFAVAIAPSDPQRVYAVLETEKDEDKGLYRSDDGGASWERTNGDFGLVVRPFYFSRIVVDPKDPNVLVKGGLTGSISRDGGKTFKNLGNMHSDIHDILFDNIDSYRMHVGTDGGVYRSWDGGETMEIVQNLPLSQFYHISLDNEEPYNIYGGLQDNGSWYGPSSSPGGIEARDWNSVGAGDGFRVFRHAEKPIVYSEMQGADNIWRIDIEKNQVTTIQPLPVKGDPKLRFNWNAALAMSPNKADRVYVGSQFLHKSDDMGNTWVKISPDLTTNDPAKQNQIESGGLSMDNSGAENHCTIFAIAESSLDENIIWVGTDDGNVQVTKDGGNTWTNTVASIEGLPSNTWAYHIEASTHDAGTAYVVFDGHTSNDWTPYVYRTTDFGQSWESIATDEIYGFARNIQEDYVNKDLLYLGTEFGLYITVDGGKHWNQFNNNMPPVAVHYVDLHPRTHDLVLGTHGRGIIIIDDISPLRKIDQEVLAKDVHFFDSEPFVMYEEGGFGGNFGSETEFVGANPNRNAKITYYLKKRHVFGKMNMAVQDLNGNTLIEISPGKSKGINVVDWNFMIKQPRVAKGKTLAFGGLTSPRVPAGDYKVIMTKGKQSYEAPLALNYDPRSPLTEEDRVFKHNTTMKLYKMSEDLAYLVYQIDAINERAEQIKEENSKSRKVMDEVINELTKLKETLVITTGDNYVGSAEPQLREKLLNLYSKVASSYNMPTATEMENLQFIEETFADARESFDAIKKKQIKKMEQFIQKNELKPVEIKAFDDFK